MLSTPREARRPQHCRVTKVIKARVGRRIGRSDSQQRVQQLVYRVGKREAGPNGVVEDDRRSHCEKCRKRLIALEADNVHAARRVAVAIDERGNVMHKWALSYSNNSRRVHVRREEGPQYMISLVAVVVPGGWGTEWHIIEVAVLSLRRRASGRHRVVLVSPINRVVINRALAKGPLRRVVPSPAGVSRVDGEASARPQRFPVNWLR